MACIRQHSHRCRSVKGSDQYRLSKVLCLESQMLLPPTPAHLEAATDSGELVVDASEKVGK